MNLKGIDQISFKDLIPQNLHTLANSPPKALIHSQGCGYNNSCNLIAACDLVLCISQSVSGLWRSDAITTTQSTENLLKQALPHKNFIWNFIESSHHSVSCDSIKVAQHSSLGGNNSVIVSVYRAVAAVRWQTELEYSLTSWDSREPHVHSLAWIFMMDGGHT